LPTGNAIDSSGHPKNIRPPSSSSGDRVLNTTRLKAVNPENDRRSITDTEFGTTISSTSEQQPNSRVIRQMVASRWKDNTFKAPHSQKARVSTALTVRGSTASATFVPQNALRPMRSSREPAVIPRRESFAQMEESPGFDRFRALGRCQGDDRASHERLASDALERGVCLEFDARECGALAERLCADEGDRIREDN
jgi:hypothetical protein